MRIKVGTSSYGLKIIVAGLLLFFFGVAGLPQESNDVPYLASAAESQAVKKFHLYATDGYLALPDGKQVYVWGYSLNDEKGTAVFPAPALEVNEGDQVEVTLTNIGPKKEGIRRLAHTIHFHGLDTDQANDGVPHTSAGIQVGESFTYRFTATHAGTYFYHCHVDTVEHMQMGMHGAFIVKAKGGADRAWTGGPAYDKEYTFVLNEIDPVWHQAVEEGAPYDRTDFHPRYWTINGKAFPDTEEDPASMITGKVGETVLIRVINSGYQAHSFHMHGFHYQVIASDGRPLPAAIEKDTINVGPAERYDLLVTFTQGGDFPIHSHNILDNTNDGVYPGGLHTMVSVASAGSGKTIVLLPREAAATIDGATASPDSQPLMINGAAFIPLRYIGEQFGADVHWIDDEQSVVYTSEQAKIQLWVDQRKALIDGKTALLEHPPIIRNGSTLVPLRFVSENLGAVVAYDPKTRQITLTFESVEHSGSHDHRNSIEEGEVDGATVMIDNSAFSIKELKIKGGTTVTWINNDSQIHTVSELNNLFDSKNILPEARWSFTFTTAGIYTYYCSTHPSMAAKVIVE